MRMNVKNLETIVESQSGMLSQYQQWLADRDFRLAEALSKNQLLNQQNLVLMQENAELLEELTKPTG